MLGARPYSSGSRHFGGYGARLIVGLALTFLPLLSSIAGAAEPPTEREALIASFEELKKAVHEKIDSDIEDVAWALWSVHEIEEARRWADFFLAPLAVVQQTIATVAALRNIQDVEAGLANASTPLGLMAYLAGVGQLEEVGTNLQMAWDGPAYSSAMRAFYDDVGKARSLQEAVRNLHLLLDPLKGPGKSISIRAPEQARARGIPSFVHRPGDVRRFVAEALNQLARDLATGTLELRPPLGDAPRGRVEQATAAIKRSKSGPLDVPPPQGSDRSQDISLGAIAGFRAAEADLMAANARHLTAEAVSVKVKAVKAVGSAILLHQTLELGGRLTTLQSTIVSVDSLAWAPVERSFSSNVREQLAAVPQQMVLALGPELTNTWLVVEELVASIRAELEPATATAEISETAPGDQVEITMGDGSVLKGQLDPAKIRFVSGYGTIEVDTSAITSFAEDRLSLEDGSMLKGAFGDGDLTLTTSQGALRLPAREIVAIRRSGISEPAPTTEQVTTTTQAPAVAQGQAVLVGRVLNRFNQPVDGATVRILGSNLRTATDSSGNYRLPYVPGKFRVVIEKEGHDSEEIELDLVQATNYPLEDRYLIPIPQSAGLYFQGKSAWLSASPCHIGGGVNRFVARAVRPLVPIVADGTSYFLDLTGARNVALLPVAADGTILRIVQQGGADAWGDLFLTPPGEDPPNLARAKVPLKWGQIGNGRRIISADLKPGVYALVSLPAEQFGAFTSGKIGPTCYMFELRGATQAEQTAPQRGVISSQETSGRTIAARWRTLTERARIRAAPSTTAEILATLPAGALVPLVASADPRAEWLAVRFDGRDAFVARRLTRPAAPPPETIDGAATVADTATLEVGGSVVHLFGVAGEGGEPARGMALFVKEQGGRISCSHKEAARYVCHLGGRDIAEVALFNGAARAAADAPESYRRREAQAREAGRGIWAH